MDKGSALPDPALGFWKAFPARAAKSSKRRTQNEKGNCSTDGSGYGFDDGGLQRQQRKRRHIFHSEYVLCAHFVRFCGERINIPKSAQTANSPVFTDRGIFLLFSA